MTTITIETETETATEAPVGWEGVLGVEGIPTGDGRYLMPGLITERDLPLTLMAQFANQDGHQGAEVAGKITEIWRQPNDNGETEIWGRGVFDTGAVGQEAARLVESDVLRGVSLDLGPTVVHAIDAATLEEIDLAGMAIDDLLQMDVLKGLEAEIMGATLCAFPAFAEASLHVVRGDQGTSVVACGYPISVKRTLLASAAKALPAEWFSFPEPDRLTPVTVTPDGQVYGHLAPWNQCHTAFPGACELAPRSRTNYAHFHTGEIDTDEGPLAVGTMTVGEAGHAPIGLSFTGAVEHYDNTGSVAAFVRASDGRHGIWLAGAVRPGASDELVRDLRAYAPSGDWRYDRNTRNLEMVAALCVPVQGFPVPRHEAAIVASGGEEHIAALVASYPLDEPVIFDRGQQRQLAVLAAHGREALAKKKPKMMGECSDDSLAYTAAERKKMAGSGEAMPDGCLSADTLVVTPKGDRAIGSLTGACVLLTDRGWRESQVACFGQASLMAVTLRRGSVERTIYATANHRWYLTDGRWVHSDSLGTQIGDDYVEADAFHPASDRVAAVTDKTTNPSSGVIMVDHKGTPVLAVGSPATARRYASADSAQSTLLKEHALEIGMTDPVLTSEYAIPSRYPARITDSDIGGASRGIFPFAELALSTATRIPHVEVGMWSLDKAKTALNKSFVGERHPAPLGSAHKQDPILSWDVVSVENTELQEDVYCAIVPGLHRFVLADGILTGNSFPIANCSDAEAAIHAQGRAKDQAAAVAHIKKRVRAMGCTGDIFQPYK